MEEITVEGIEINPAVMLGKPVVKGTRITVELIVEKLKHGASIEDLLDAHPRLTREGIQAAIDFYEKDTNRRSEPKP